MRIMLKLWFAFLVAGVSFAAEQALDKFEISLSQSSYKVGDKHVYELKRVYGGNSVHNAQLKNQGSLELGFFIKNGSIYFVRSGEVTVPSLKVFSGEIEIGTTDPLIVKVDSSQKNNEPNTENNENIQEKPPEPIGPKSIGLPYSVLIVFVFFTAIFIFVIGYYFYNKFIKNKKQTAVPTARAPTPYEVVNQILNSLEQELEKQSKHDWKKFYFKVSDSLKAYMSDELDCDARESTTSEMFMLLESEKLVTPLDAECLKLLKETFQVLDLVKFTKYEPDISETKSILDNSKKIVKKIMEQKQGVKHAL